MADFSRSSIGSGVIFRQTSALIQRNLLLCAMGALVMFAIKTGWDLSVRQWLVTEPKTAVLWGSVSLPILGVAHYLLTLRLMQAERLTERGWSPGALLNYLLAYILATIGTILGIILLIVPGIIWALRWVVYGNFVIARGLGPVEAIKASWEATRGSAGAIFGVTVVLGLIGLVGGFVIRGGLSTPANLSIAQLVSSNVLTEVVSMATLCVVTAIYALLAGADHTGLTEVFA